MSNSQLSAWFPSLINETVTSTTVDITDMQKNTFAYFDRFRYVAFALY